MARLAGSCHLDAVDAQLSGKVPKHIGLLQGGLVIKRVHDDGLAGEVWNVGRLVGNR